MITCPVPVVYASLRPPATFCQPSGLWNRGTVETDEVIEVTGRVASATVRETSHDGDVIDYFHLLKDKNRWWIVSKLWDAESENLIIDSEVLPNALQK